MRHQVGLSRDLLADMECPGLINGRVTISPRNENKLVLLSSDDCNSPLVVMLLGVLLVCPLMGYQLIVGPFCCCFHPTTCRSNLLRNDAALLVSCSVSRMQKSDNLRIWSVGNVELPLVGAPPR